MMRSAFMYASVSRCSEQAATDDGDERRVIPTKLNFFYLARKGVVEQP